MTNIVSTMAINGNCITFHYHVHFVLNSYSGTHDGHVLALETQKCLRPDPRING